MNELLHLESYEMPLNNFNQGIDFQFMNEKRHIGRNANGGLQMADPVVKESAKNALQCGANKY